jgi:hypothetical protein
MLRGKNVINLFLIFGILLCGCTQKQTVIAASKPAPSPAADTKAYPRDADDTARFLAGMPSKPGSPYAALESTPAWIQHRNQLDAAWAKTEEELLGGLRQFQQTELSSGPVESRKVFYPFGGPDALVATYLFPHSPEYFIVGLEPAGTLPAPDKIEKKDLFKYLAAVRETMSSVLGKSFFITHQMDAQFRGQVTDGLILPIIHLLVRTDHTVLGLKYVRIDNDGTIVDRPAIYTSSERFYNKGVELEFRTGNDPAIHKLYYFSVNLMDDRLRDNKAFLTYMSHYKGTSTFLKATSYMTHRKDFSLIREIMLNNSASILQDDSGIPYRWFGSDVWRVQLYGAYDHPYGSFKWLQQPDLRKAYATSGTKPLPMHIGYGYRRIASNLLYAERINQVAAR